MKNQFNSNSPLYRTLDRGFRIILAVTLLLLALGVVWFALLIVAVSEGPSPVQRLIIGVVAFAVAAVLPVGAVKLATGKSSNDDDPTATASNGKKAIRIHLSIMLSLIALRTGWEATEPGHPWSERTILGLVAALLAFLVFKVVKGKSAT